MSAVSIGTHADFSLKYLGVARGALAAAGLAGAGGALAGGGVAGHFGFVVRGWRG